MAPLGSQPHPPLKEIEKQAEKIDRQPLLGTVMATAALALEGPGNHGADCGQAEWALRLGGGQDAVVVGALWSTLRGRTGFRPQGEKPETAGYWNQLAEVRCLEVLKGLVSNPGDVS